MPAWKRQVPRKTSPTGYVWEVRWEDLNGKDRQKTFPIKADPDNATDARGRRVKPRSVEKIAEAAEKEAARFCIQVDLELESGKSTAPMTGKGKRFREVAEQMMDASKRLKPKTRRGYEDAYKNHIYDTFGERRISQITSLDVEAWLDDMQTKPKPKGDPDAPDEPYAASSVRGIYVALSKVFKYAQKHQLITVNPCSAVERPRVIREEVEFHTPGEIAAVAEWLDDVAPYGLVVRFAAYTGLRPGELEALRIRDINFLRRHVAVRRQAQYLPGEGLNYVSLKSKRANRDVPLAPSLLVALREHIAQHPYRNDPDALLWPGRRKGGAPGARAPLSYDAPARHESIHSGHVRPAMEELGIRPLVWYAFRHFYASAIAAAGYTIHDLARWMGHENIQLTYDTYMHLFPDTHDMANLDVVAATTPVRPLKKLG